MIGTVYTRYYFRFNHNPDPPLTPPHLSRVRISGYAPAAGFHCCKSGDFFTDCLRCAARARLCCESEALLRERGFVA